jgi:hypothetical protein
MNHGIKVEFNTIVTNHTLPILQLKYQFHHPTPCPHS